METTIFCRDYIRVVLGLYYAAHVSCRTTRPKKCRTHPSVTMPLLRNHFEWPVSGMK